MIRKAIALTVLVSLLLVVLGCGGGGAKNYNITRATTLGQELKDLKEAYDRGAISQSEYDEMKEKVLKSQDER